MNAKIFPSKISGAVTAPPSKSMAHRAMLCAALAEGVSCITNLADSEDLRATRRVLTGLGARFAPIPGGFAVTGAARLTPPDSPLDCGESGSTLRFAIPLAALCGAPVTFTGHGRLLQRPQSVYEALFRGQGLQWRQTPDALTVGGPLRAGAWTVDGGVSSQFISGLLLAMPLLDAPARLTVRPPFESESYVGLTAQAMAAFGVPVRREENTYWIEYGKKYNSANMAVEGDWSQAAFFAVLGAVRGGVTVRGLASGSRQGDKAVLDALARCGAAFVQDADGCHFEKSALRAAPIDLTDCPDLGPVLMVLGLFCQGETVLTGARRLRLKESDRIAVMEEEIRKLGGVISSTENTVTVRGGPLHGAQLDGHNDHRVVMAMAVAALCAGVPATIAGAEAVDKSYPAFFDDIRRLGAEVETT